MKEVGQKASLGPLERSGDRNGSENEAWGRHGAPSWRCLLSLFSVWVSGSLCAWLEPSFARAAFWF